MCVTVHTEERHMPASDRLFDKEPELPLIIKKAYMSDCLDIR